MSFLALITRYLNEPFLDEFVEYYLHEGVDHIFVLIDAETSIPVSKKTQNNPKVSAFMSYNFKQRQTHDVNHLYSTIRNKFTWVIFVDCDEFITTYKNEKSSIRKELETTFRDVDCIKIPWVMMSSNGQEKDPPSVLQYLNTRWNHDLRHPHPSKWHKGRCRYDSIEVKCISRCSKFKTLNLHHPMNETKDAICIDSVDCEEAYFNPFFENLRESSIRRAYMLCFHYRIYSQESAKRKLINNKLDGYKKTNFSYLMQSDYSDTVDDFMKNKSIAYFGKK
jgi:hypothetical protein